MKTRGIFQRLTRGSVFWQMFTHRVEDRLRDTQKLLGVDIKRPEVRLLEEERNEAPLCEGRQK